MHHETVAGEDRRHGRSELRVTRGIVARADDHLMVLHPARAPGVAIEQHRVPVGVTELGEQVLQSRVVGIVERLQLRFEVGEPERARKDGRVARGMGAHHPASGAHLAVVVLEVIAAAIDVDEHARKRRREDRGPVLMQIGVEIAREGVGKPVGEGFEPGLAVVVAGDVGQRLRAVVGHAHQDRRALPRRGMPDDRERALHGRCPSELSMMACGTDVAASPTSTPARRGVTRSTRCSP